MWYRSIKCLVSNWNSLLEQLKTDFFRGDIDEDIWDQIKLRKQKRNESIALYFAHVENLFQRLTRIPAEITKVSYIRKNLLPEYISQLALLDINTIEKLKELCRKIEEAEYLKNKNKPINQMLNIMKIRLTKTIITTSKAIQIFLDPISIIILIKQVIIQIKITFKIIILEIINHFDHKHNFRQNGRSFYKINQPSTSNSHNNLPLTVW